MRWVLMLCLFLGWVVAQAPQLTIPPVPLSSAWTSVALPEMPLGIVAHDGVLWVCGANEMIAESSDAGRHWVLRHWSPQGAEMLFSMAFTGAGIQAFGTAGTHLVSNDGGATWTAQSFDPEEAILDVELGDATHAYASTARGYAVSADGGRHWKFEHPAGGPARVAVRDGLHAGVLSASDAEGRRQAVMTTSDGGDHWQHADLSSGAAWIALWATAQGYSVWGRDMGKGAAVAEDFTEAGGWKEAPPAYTVELCGLQGCELANGWLDTSGRKPQAWGLPEDKDSPIHLDTAMVGDTFCAISDMVRCRSGRDPWTPPSVEASPTGKISPARCVHCPRPGFPKKDENARRKGAVVIALVIGVDGTPGDLALAAAPSADMAKVAMAAVRQWKYSPLMRGGKPMQVFTLVTFHFVP
jgi:hypothetical protein